MHRLTNPRSACPDTPAAHRPPDCRLVIPDFLPRTACPSFRTARRRSPSRSESRGARRPPRSKFRPGFREPDEQGEPGPIPCATSRWSVALNDLPGLPTTAPRRELGAPEKGTADIQPVRNSASRPAHHRRRLRPASRRLCGTLPSVLIPKFC